MLAPVAFISGDGSDAAAGPASLSSVATRCAATRRKPADALVDESTRRPAGIMLGFL